MKAVRRLAVFQHRVSSKVDHRSTAKPLHVPGSVSSISLSRGFTSSANIVHSDLPDVVIPGGQIPHLIAGKTAQYLGTVALEDGITGETVTYDQLLDQVRRSTLTL